MPFDNYDDGGKPPLDPYYEVRLLRRDNARLVEENERLHRENGDLMFKWVAALDQSASRLVMGLLNASKGTD